MTIQKALETATVAEIVFTDTPRVWPDTPLLEVVLAMREAGTNSVLVCEGNGENGQLSGTYTERDYLEYLGTLKSATAREEDLAVPVSELMTARPVTLSPHEPIIRAMEIMYEQRYRNIPVVDDEGKPRGIVRMTDILHYVAEILPHSVLNLPPRPQKPIQVPEGA